jgi:undecaprenyl diphosphate synthase
MKLLNRSLNNNLIKKLNKNNVIFKWIGFKDKLSINLIDKIKRVEKLTKNNNGLTLTIAFNYGGKQDILQAAKLSKSTTTINDFNKLLLTKSLPDVDLLIRTGGDKRISNFLLWQSAYAELVFEPTFWPSYNKKHFANNILEYCSRQRRFGKI